jgi:hypothetical protein
MFGRGVVETVVCAGFFVDGKVVSVACWADIFACVIAGLQFAEVLQNRKCHGVARDRAVLAGKSRPVSPLLFLKASFRKPVVDAPGNYG